MIHYIIQTVAYQLLFLLVFDLALKKETFFKANRYYLLGATALSYVLPLIRIDAIQRNIPEEMFVRLPAVVVGTAESNMVAVETNSLLSSIPWWGFLWITGILVMSALLICKFIRLAKLKRTGQVSRFSKFDLIILPGSDAAFTFFRNIFMGEKLSEHQRQHILLHEKVHVEDRHSWDLMFYELLKLVCWFNPLVYILQQRMVTLQEFTADARVAKESDKRSYYEGLLSQVFQTEKISFVNTFFNHSLIKKRVIMLQKSKSKSIYRLKYLFLLPLVMTMLIYSSCSDDPEVKQEEASYSQQIAELRMALEAKDELTQEEKDEIALMIHKLYPRGTEKITGADGNVEFHFREEGENEFIHEFDKQQSVPFTAIDKAPVFPGCEGLDGPAAKKCFTTKLSETVIRHFKLDDAQAFGLEEKVRMAVNFVVTTEGEIEILAVKSPDPSFETAVRRAMDNVPTLIPGEHEGKKVNVQFALPILYAVNE